MTRRGGDIGATMTQKKQNDTTEDPIPAEHRGPEPGRCGSCGQFVEGGAIICHSCDVAERRREFHAMLP